MGLNFLFKKTIEKATIVKDASIFAFQIIPAYLPTNRYGFTKNPSIIIAKLNKQYDLKNHSYNNHNKNK